MSPLNSGHSLSQTYQYNIPIKLLNGDQLYIKDIFSSLPLMVFVHSFDFFIGILRFDEDYKFLDLQPSTNNYIKIASVLSQIISICYHCREAYGTLTKTWLSGIDMKQ